LGLGCVITRWRGPCHEMASAQKRGWPDHALIAAINGLLPMMFMTRVRL
jgi:hypothetical protein